MEPENMNPLEGLHEWYTAQRTLKIDIVGDFAGGELFAVHGESLIRYCLEQSRVDFDGGFQLMHAVYAVEKFLHDLQKRGCNFDIIFFRDLEGVCAPKEDTATYKWDLTRAVLIRHLARSEIRSGVHEFDSFESDDCKEYLSSRSLHFILCHEGDGDEGRKTIQLRLLIWKFASSGRHVALINSISWQISKVFVHLLSQTKTPTDILHNDITASQSLSEPPVLQTTLVDGYMEPNDRTTNLTLREWFAINFVCVFLGELGPGTVHKVALNDVHALLLHTAALRMCHLQDRRCEALEIDSKSKDFLHLFSIVCQKWVQRGVKSGGMAWDLFDMIDGRIFSFMVKKVKTNNPVPEEIMQTACGLWKEVTRLKPRYSDSQFDIALPPTIPSSLPAESAEILPSILAFDHPTFNKYVGSIRTNEAKETIDPAASIVFEDLQHWHNNKTVHTWKNHPRPGFYARKRKQELMSEVVTYAASLQNASGKMLDRETVVVKSYHGLGSTSKPGKPQAKNTQKQVGKQSTKKSGKENALKAAQEIQDRKATARRDDVTHFWAQKCAQFQTDPSLVSQYLKADKFLSSRSQKDGDSLSAEVRLYLCHILGNIWIQVRKEASERSPEGLYLISMMWHSLQGIAGSKTCTPEIAAAVQGITTCLRMPHIGITTGEPSRPLPFLLDTEAAAQMTRLPDPRVPFNPDEWQRKVLDAIDADENLLVVAPTSAGKTFISFYAMKKVLEESDDAVLVYVAPTKALVNQIAAEVEARFSKSYNNKAGKSVWGVHTRDYRINNPSGCQVLVTVPHILQIMLLSPANSNHPNSWSRRVRRIIFDEVHCIGQAEDGVVWEQLLLLAPCPIIALSATVGNRDEFRHWLEVSRVKKDAKMTMVVHEARYSDLRKFIYQPPAGFYFEKLVKAPRLPVPGLDEGNAISQNFKFVHPVAALRDCDGAVLDDVTLEARDCLSLWEKMNKTVLPEFMSEVVALNPLRILPQAISKSDIVGWEKRLKAALRAVMETSPLCFRELQASLDPDLQQVYDTMPTMTKGEKKSKTVCTQPMQDHVVSLFSLVCELHSQNALPALAFSYDRLDCERAAKYICNELANREKEWKDSDTGWLDKVRRFTQWKKQAAGQRELKAAIRKKDASGDAAKTSKLDLVRDEASTEISAWDSFNVNAPLEQFSFADTTKMLKSEFDKMIQTLHQDKVKPVLVEALERGIGVHHAGMNRRYRQIVEMLFRRGYLRVVVATGTLALGINMPCKTVIFSGDSIFLTAQNYRQASGRAGRRGFDLLGNVVFNGIPQDRVYEIMSSRLPDLKGQFPISTTLILRLFGLLHGTNNSEFATDAVSALLSQTRLYLGGPDAEMSVKHHVRFSIEYLRRQNLISANGTPLNFAGLVGHLYFTENSVFAFHSLLRGGYFHELCADINNNPEKVLHEMMLVLSHLFNRFPIRRTKERTEEAKRSASSVFLKPLPEAAETLLIQHNRQTLSIFKDCVHSYIGQYLRDKPDRTMPFTKTVVGPSGVHRGAFLGCPGTTIRSPFISLSGFGDDFDTVKDLCSTVRGDVFLEESAIPYLRIWPYDTKTELNAFLYDFYNHGSMEVLVRDNHIKNGDVWFILQDFSLTLKAIVSSLKSYASSNENLDGDDDSNRWDESESEDLCDPGTMTPETSELMALGEANKEKKQKKEIKVIDSWEDGSGDSELDAESDTSDTRGSHPRPRSVHQVQGEGLTNVVNAFTILQEGFEAKFRKVWA